MNWNEYKNLIAELLDKLVFDKEILQILKDSIKNNQKIFIAGNGGSAANAAHLSCDLSLGANKDWKENSNRYKAIPLTENTPYLLAIANDTDYSQVFKQQLINLASKNDILIAISGSGNSPNILEAVQYAKEKGMITIGISGYDGGKLKKLSDFNVHVESMCMEACEDVHCVFSHFLATWLRENSD